ncbi:MAG: HEAT repeat domain-containing protein [Planctomycetes bacterium]|nr:HEAT repeat domain-containing protein [Planctomycetota bacterium]
MRIVDTDFDSLVESVGASRRLATRIGALARQGLFVTETLVELAADDDGKPLATLLLSKSLLDSADALDQDALARLTKSKWFKDNPVALVQRQGRRIVCLAEEADSPATASGRALMSAPGAANALIPPEEASRLLPAEELARLKLDLVTSADAGRRLEALRKLFLGGLSTEEKTALFLSALRDREPDVRAEGARALGAMGLDAALTENLARAASASAAERVAAISNLGQVLLRLEPVHRQLVAGAVLEMAIPSEEREVVLAVLGLLSTRLADAGDARSLLPSLHGKLTALLQVHFLKFEDAARGVYAAMFAVDPETVSGLLSRTVEDSSQENLRFFALGLITRHHPEATGRPAVVAQFVNGLCTGSELDRNYQSCAAALVRLGDVAVDGLLESLPRAEETGRRRIVDLFGHMLRGGDDVKPVGSAAATRAAEACIDLYSDASAELRTSILESGVVNHAAVGTDLRRRAVEAFVDSLHEFRFERQIELVQLALAQCGRVALEPLHQAMLHSGHDVTRLSAALLLPRIVEATIDLPASTLVGLVSDIREIADAEETDFPDRGPLFIALGRIGAHPSFPGPDADRLCAHLRESLGRTSAVYDVLEGLGYIAAGTNLSSAERLEAGYLLLGVLKKGVPAQSARLRKNEDGEEVLHFGRETTAYTDMIPRILEGLGRMLEAPRTPEALFTRIVRDLLEIWAQITDYRRIWAPAATMTLANLLGQIALGSRRPDAMVDEIAELLSRKLILLPVLQVISHIAAARPTGESMDKLSARIFAELHKRLNSEPAPEFTERRQLLQTMTALVQRPRLGDRDKDIEQARRVVIEALFDAMRGKVIVARGLLDSLAKGQHIPQSMRDDIARRLKPAR